MPSTSTLLGKRFSLNEIDGPRKKRLKVDPEEEIVIFICRIDDQHTVRLTALFSDDVHFSVAKGFNCKPHHIERILFGSHIDVFPGESFADHGIEDGGRLTVQIAEG